MPALAGHHMRQGCLSRVDRAEEVCIYEIAGLKRRFKPVIGAMPVKDACVDDQHADRLMTFDSHIPTRDLICIANVGLLDINSCTKFFASLSNFGEG